ncbi:TetR/AcrR family transcriptional regulator [Pseudomonas chengduensis]|jgi:TetR/AcrR family transcriptional repressor of nem operon|nr:TetR/AcrR family transcriptional regulator [Pseudomonas chengduensis]
MTININVFLPCRCRQREEPGMKVTKAQVEANRAHIVETACTLFRERGYDGIGVAELMATAGLTHGGFYRHFSSKAELMSEAAACGVAKTRSLMGGVDMADFISHYLSREHRDDRSGGCTLAALSGDAARQPDAIKATFATGLENMLADLLAAGGARSEEELRHARARTIDTVAHALGALVLSRACPDDSPLADEILQSCRTAILESREARMTTG